MKRFLSTIIVIAIILSGCSQKPGKASTCHANNTCLENEDTSLYLSKEYLEEKSYNIRKNIYYGYTLDEIESSFEGDKYVFALDEEGHTIVKEFEVYENYFEKVFRNICVGTGVILVCFTLSVVTGALGMPTAYVMFSFATNSATSTAINFAVIGAAISGTISAYKTGDLNEVFKSMLIGGSNGFMTGAIIGAFTGTYSAARQIRYMRNTVISPRDAELFAQARYSGEEQVSFLNGEVVTANTLGATRPDIVRMVDGHIEAIEVKRYDLENHLDELLNTLHNQVGSRVVNLPVGSTQRIVLDVQGRRYSEAFLDEVVDTIQWELDDVYPNIPVDIQGWVP